MNIHFGPAGNSKSFYDEGGKRSVQMPAWLRERGLDIYEYSCGRGVNLGLETAAEIGRAAREAGVGVSIDAPYLIHFANPDPDKRAKSRDYIYRSAELAGPLGAQRVVFHPGSTKGMPRAEALAMALEEMPRLMEELAAQLQETAEKLDPAKLTGEELESYIKSRSGDLWICPETMGKINQLGDLDEVLALCQCHPKLLPAIDFGHLNARTQGGLKGEEDYARVLDAMGQALDADKLQQFHIHFSHIEYTQAGEKQHLTFEDEVYGPFFEPLAVQLVRRGLTPWIICESKDTMAEDALRMKQCYQKAGGILG